MVKQSPCIQAVLFDLEHTLIVPAERDLARLRQVGGGRSGQSLLKFLNSPAGPAPRSRLLNQLNRAELAAAANCAAAAGAEQMLQYLRSRRLRLGIISCWGISAVKQVLQNFKTVGPDDFDLILGREDLLALAGNPTLLAARRLDLDASQVVVVSAAGSSIGQNEETLTVAFEDQPGGPGNRLAAEAISSNFKKLQQVIRLATALPAGKLPNDLLHEFLGNFVFDDPSVLIKPAIGEDTAAVDIAPEEVLVLKSDPITFATDAIGQYAVLINANDIVTAGALPRWFLTTLLLPTGITGYEIRRIIAELSRFCRQWGITLCGGHTEITDAVRRPIVSGMMAGTVARKDLIDKRHMHSGDRLLLTKKVAVEGTAIIAREFNNRLQQLGMTEAQIDNCRQFLASISILPEAKIAAQAESTSAMHDVTEGGLATAVEELSIAGGHRLRIDLDGIPIFDETRRICDLLGIHPLGLIGSGSLLICCRPEGCEPLMAAIQAAGIEVAGIGEVLERGRGVEALKQKKPAPWPRFEVDEITRLF